MKRLIMSRHGFSRWQAYRDFERRIHRKFGGSEYLRSYDVNDVETPLLQFPDPDAHAIGQWLLGDETRRPDVFVVSPYKRVLRTLDSVLLASVELANIPVIMDDAVTEQDFGIVDEYGGFRAFLEQFPDEMARYKQEGKFNYVIPDGESRAQVCERAAMWYIDALDEYRGMFVYLFSHHNFIMDLRWAIEGWDFETFMRIEYDPDLKPFNCGVTQYTDHGDGLRLKFHNVKVSL